MPDSLHTLEEAITTDVRRALAEDVGTGDLTAALLPAGKVVQARLLTRQDAVLCGTEWFNRAVETLDPEAEIFWHHADGDDVVAGTSLCELEADARALLTAERTAINFVQLLSAVATRTRTFVKLVQGTRAKILDTRKTLPGLRIAQKYAVSCGGCHNHRIGLYDAFLIKENHIAACGSIAAAIRTAREQAPGKPVEVEVETMAQLAEALDARADSVMLDNFDLAQMREAVAFTAGRTVLEASGGVNESTLRAIAETGVDYISIGTLTKDCKAIDLSMRML